VIDEHLVDGRPVEELTIGANRLPRG